MASQGPEVRRLVELRLQLPVINGRTGGTATGCCTQPTRGMMPSSFRKTNTNWSFPKEEFTPLAMETGGRMDPAFREFLTRCVIRALGAEKYSELESEARAVYGDTIKYLLTSISVAIARAAGLSLLHLSEACAKERNKPAVQQAAAGGVAGAGGAQAGGAAPAAAGH